jgi:hypothetical protein
VGEFNEALAFAYIEALPFKNQEQKEKILRRANAFVQSSGVFVWGDGRSYFVAPNVIKISRRDLSNPAAWDEELDHFVRFRRIGRVGHPMLGHVLEKNYHDGSESSWARLYPYVVGFEDAILDNDFKRAERLVSEWLDLEIRNADEFVRTRQVVDRFTFGFVLHGQNDGWKPLGSIDKSVFEAEKVQASWEVFQGSVTLRPAQKARLAYLNKPKYLPFVFANLEDCLLRSLDLEPGAAKKNIDFWARASAPSIRSIGATELAAVALARKLETEMPELIGKKIDGVELAVLFAEKVKKILSSN